MKRIVLILFIWFFSLNAVDIGSDTAVTRFNTQQVVGNGDRIAGFAALAAGFALAGVGTIGTFDTFFPVIGDVSFSFGHLVLNQDIIFHNVSNVTKLGQVSGHGHAIELASSMDCIPTAFGPSCDISFLDNIVGPANVNGVDWNRTNTLIAIATNSGGDDLSVYLWDGSTLTLEDSVNLARTANTVSWHPTNDWVAVGINGGTGDDLFNYDFSTGSLVLLDSVDTGGTGATVNSVIWHPSGEHLAVGTNDAAAELRVYEVDGSGLFGASVTVDLSADANAVDWNITGSFLVVGTDPGGGFDELRTYTFTKSPLDLTFDASFDTGERVNAVSWNKRSPDTDIIAVGLNTGSDRLQIYRHAKGSLTNLSTSLAISDVVNSVHWHPASACLAAGLNSSADFEVQIFLFSNDTLTLDSNAALDTNVNSVRWSRDDGDYLAVGENDNDLTVYQFDANFADPTKVIFSNVILFMNSNITLRETSITFSGESVIDGRGNTLTLASTFTLMVDEQSSLLIRDVTLEGIKGSDIRGLDEQSTFSLQDVTMVLDGDFTFSIGILDILKDFKISGPNHTFVYSSDQQSAIRGGLINPTSQCSPFYSGALIIDHGVTFSYDPPSNVATLLMLESDLSRLVLDGGTLFADTLSLTKGTLQIDSKSTLNALTSITFGDGTAANNLHINLFPAASFDVIGNLINNNV